MNRGTRIYLIALVFGAAMLQLYFNSKINHEKNMVAEAMAIEEDELGEGSVTAYGYYGNEAMTEEKRTIIVTKLANELGITEGYEISTRETEDGRLTALTKKGEQADTRVKVISLNSGENYLYTELILKGVAGRSAYQYKEKLSEMYADLGISASSNLYLMSQRKGELTDEEKQKLTEDFLDSLDAQSVKKLTFDGVDMTYGYSKGIDEYVLQDGLKVNVNIAFSYDESEDITYIHRGIPFVDRSF
ncbi:MAG: YwmB family TATA-box binding protein [Lachnospiraceae bacterium]|nr:YwmB family TATA-box binding protein [Lachnospiraceae bacterium]